MERAFYISKQNRKGSGEGMYCKNNLMQEFSTTNLLGDTQQETLELGRTSHEKLIHQLIVELQKK